MTLRRIILSLGVLLALSLPLFADMLSTSEVLLAPNGQIQSRSSLDNEEPDTLYYDDDGTQSFYFNQLTNYWVYVRFTPPSNFQLRSIYVALGNPSGSTVPCSLFVCTPNGNRPGTVLGQARLAPVPPGSAWHDITLPDSIDFDANEDFMIVVGRSPGPNAWYPLLDGGSTVNRSAYTTGNRSTGTYNTITNDLRIRAGGEFEAFLDISAEQCFDVVNGNSHSFNILPGEDVRLKALVGNPSNQTAVDYTVAWTIRGPNGSTVFTNEIAAGPLDAAEFQSVQASAEYTPTVEGEYFATCVVNTDNDANALNDTTYFRFFVGGLDRWYRYDDSDTTSDGLVTFQAGTGIGISYKPSVYPAQVEQLRVFAGAAGVGEMRLYANGNDGAPTGNALWTSQPDLAAGWNDIEVNPPVGFYSGSFTAVYFFTDIALGKDNDPPNAAAIDSMGHVAWQGDGTSWDADPTGNWMIQAYLTEAPAPPIIATRPDTLQFGAVDTTGATSVTLQLWVRNDGTGGNLNVTSMTINPSTIRSAFNFSPATLNIPAGDSAVVNMTFNPAAVRSYNGFIAIANNSQNAPTKNVIIRASGVSGGTDADEIPGTLPTQYELSQNYPNPFNPETFIQFALPTSSNIKLKVYDILGQEIVTLAEGNYSAGTHRVNFSGKNLTSGLYFYKLEAGAFTDMKKMMLLK